MLSRFIGGILLITGTSIGAGMLALPIVNSGSGICYSTLYLVLCWIIMTLGAFYILEASLYLPRGNHMVSMAKATLGNYGLIIAWLCYLLLLYTLLSAYISGGSDVFLNLLSNVHINLANWQGSLCFTLIFGLIVYQGIRYVDLLNRGLMFIKLGIYLILVLLIAPHIKIQPFQSGAIRYLNSSLMILITSFGFAIIVPNLRDYFDDNVKQLKQVILVGSFIPLICYLAWDAVIIGSLPVSGSHSLTQLIHSSRPTTDMALLLEYQIHNSTIHHFFQLFTSVCMLTAFLGVSLCLYSFLADGLQFRKQGIQGLSLFGLTFVPPLLIVVYYPAAYLYALGYAGSLCVILLLLLPACMCYKGRVKYEPRFKVFGGKPLQMVVILISLILLVHEIIQLV